MVNWVLDAKEPYWGASDPSNELIAIEETVPAGCGDEQSSQQENEEDKRDLHVKDGHAEGDVQPGGPGPSRGAQDGAYHPTFPCLLAGWAHGVEADSCEENGEEGLHWAEPDLLVDEGGISGRELESDDWDGRGR